LNLRHGIRYHVHDGGILRVVSYGRQSDAGGRCSIKLFSSADVPMSSVGRSVARPGRRRAIQHVVPCGSILQARRTHGRRKPTKQKMRHQATNTLYAAAAAAAAAVAAAAAAQSGRRSRPHADSDPQKCPDRSAVRGSKVCLPIQLAQCPGFPGWSFPMLKHK